MDFNDPLDMFLQEALGMDEVDFLSGLRPAFYDFIAGDIDYASLRDSPSRNKIILMNTGLKNASARTREKIRNELLNTPVEELWDLDRIRSTTRETFSCLKNLFQHDGIFCSTIDPNNLLMWAHYAEQHKGAVIEFTPCIEKDSPLLASKQVQYTSIRPLLYRNPVDIIVHGLTMTPYESARKIIEGIIYTKSLHWSYEKEFRLYIPKFIANDKQYETLSFYGYELTSMYLGCRMNNENKLQAVALASAINPSIRVYDAHIVPREFELQFNEFAGA